VRECVRPAQCTETRYASSTRISMDAHSAPRPKPLFVRLYTPSEQAEERPEWPATALARSPRQHHQSQRSSGFMRWWQGSVRATESTFRRSTLPNPPMNVHDSRNERALTPSTTGAPPHQHPSATEVMHKFGIISCVRPSGRETSPHCDHRPSDPPAHASHWRRADRRAPTRRECSRDWHRVAEAHGAGGRVGLDGDVLCCLTRLAFGPRCCATGTGPRCRAWPPLSLRVAFSTPVSRSPNRSRAAPARRRRAG